MGPPVCSLALSPSLLIAPQSRHYVSSSSSAPLLLHFHPSSSHLSWWSFFFFCASVIWHHHAAGIMSFTAGVYTSVCVCVWWNGWSNVNAACPYVGALALTSGGVWCSDSGMCFQHSHGAVSLICVQANDPKLHLHSASSSSPFTVAQLLEWFRSISPANLFTHSCGWLSQYQQNL